MESYRYLHLWHFSFQLMLLLAFYAVPLPRRSRFGARLLCVLAIYFTASIPFYKIVRRIAIAEALLAMLIHLFLFCAIMGLLSLCVQTDLRSILFTCVAAYATQHATFALTRLIMLLCPSMPAWMRELVLSYLLFLLAGIGTYQVLVRPNISGGLLRPGDFRMVLVMLAVLLCSISLSSLVLNGAVPSPVAQGICWVYAIISCSLGLAMQFGISGHNGLEEANRLLEQMLHNEKQQHDMAKDTIDIINRKCHDLKYQIAAFRDMDSRTERAASIQEMEQSVMIYDNLIRSGCDALDVILTEKTLLFEQYGIRHDYIIDGARLAFMSSVDIYTLFHNALDNAIESVLKAPESQRSICLRVQAKRQMLLIHLDNTCLEPPRFVDGIPQTTKDDHAYHGFGTRSICYLAQKYGGEVWMRAEQERFFLDLVFVQPE